MPSPRPPEFRRRAIELARQGDNSLLRLAKDPSISHSRLQNRLKQDDADAKSGKSSQLTSEIKMKITELDRRNKQLQTENDFLHRAARLALEKGSTAAIYALVRALADDNLPVARAWRVLHMSTSGYDDWRNRPEPPREPCNKELTELIRQIHTDSHGRYGSPRIYARSRFRLGGEASHKPVERFRREAGQHVIHHREPAERDSREGVTLCCAEDQAQPARAAVPTTPEGTA
ncbi:hypothetical protein GCM10009850_115190 [Nonomuraea monospora]|uniref:HTH-like domain-containing protein n=1 Tax=Nonomuraea monospora TaxID=568818 RepID=A0ABN3D2L5_9ACTN